VGGGAVGACRCLPRTAGLSTSPSRCPRPYSPPHLLAGHQLVGVARRLDEQRVGALQHGAHLHHLREGGWGRARQAQGHEAGEGGGRHKASCPPPAPGRVGQATQATGRKWRGFRGCGSRAAHQLGQRDLAALLLPQVLAQLVRGWWVVRVGLGWVWGVKRQGAEAGGEGLPPLVRDLPAAAALLEGPLAPARAGPRAAAHVGHDLGVGLRHKHGAVALLCRGRTRTAGAQGQHGCCSGWLACLLCKGLICKVGVPRARPVKRAHQEGLEHVEVGDDALGVGGGGGGRGEGAGAEGLKRHSKRRGARHGPPHHCLPQPLTSAASSRAPRLRPPIAPAAPPHVVDNHKLAVGAGHVGVAVGRARRALRRISEPRGQGSGPRPAVGRRRSHAGPPRRSLDVAGTQPPPHPDKPRFPPLPPPRLPCPAHVRRPARVADADVPRVALSDAVVVLAEDLGRAAAQVGDLALLAAGDGVREGAQRGVAGAGQLTARVAGPSFVPRAADSASGGARLRARGS
jgi:hypothetical protein